MHRIGWLLESLWEPFTRPICCCCWLSSSIRWSVSSEKKNALPTSSQRTCCSNSCHTDQCHVVKATDWSYARRMVVVMVKNHNRAVSCCRMRSRAAYGQSRTSFYWSLRILQYTKLIHGNGHWVILRPSFVTCIKHPPLFYAACRFRICHVSITTWEKFSGFTRLHTLMSLEQQDCYAEPACTCVACDIYIHTAQSTFPRLLSSHAPVNVCSFYRASRPAKIFRGAPIFHCVRAKATNLPFSSCSPTHSGARSQFTAQKKRLQISISFRSAIIERVLVASCCYFTW